MAHEEAGEEVGAHDEQQEGHEDGEHADEEVGEGEPPAHLPQEGAEGADREPEEDEDRRRGERQAGERRHVRQAGCGEDHEDGERDDRNEPGDRRRRGHREGAAAGGSLGHGRRARRRVRSGRRPPGDYGGVRAEVSARGPTTIPGRIAGPVPRHLSAKPRASRRARFEETVPCPGSPAPRST
jgi:hypothetical protein